MSDVQGCGPGCVRGYHVQADPTPTDVRFWSKVGRRGPDECWEWTGNRSTRGYGQFYLDGKLRPAHRIAWELTHDQPFPEGMDGCHHCDNPPCVNPAHIFPGTASDNQIDSLRKGRRVYTVGTHCAAGHPYDYTVYFATRNRRQQICVQCRRANERRRWRESRKAVAP